MGNFSNCGCTDDSTKNQKQLRNNAHRPEPKKKSLHMGTIERFGDKSKHEKEIHKAARDENITYLEYLIDNGVDINAQTSTSKDTALHIAARINSKAVITILVDKNADTTIRNRDGKLPFDLCDPSLKQQFNKKIATQTVQSRFAPINCLCFLLACVYFVPKQY